MNVFPRQPPRSRTSDGITIGMGWRKVGDDGQELCRLLDYVLGGVQTLKSSIQSGRRLDGKGEMKVDAVKLWCSGLYRDPADDDDDTSVDLKDAKDALRRMKDAKSLLSSVSKSLDDAIQTVTDDISSDCRATGLSLLPDDVLTDIFEKYVELSVEGEESFHSMFTPYMLASVCRRFRQIVFACSDLWKHVFLRFPETRLLALKDRCSNPIVHLGAEYKISHWESDKFAFVQPCQQWRELRLAYANGVLGHLYFERLKSLIQTPLESLERLSITNELKEAEDEEQTTPSPIYLDGDDLRTLSSWQMPNLIRLELRNVIPMAPLQCENVTSFSLRLYDHKEETLNMATFQNLLQSMPKLQSLSVSLNVSAGFDASSDTLLALPDLRSFDLQIKGPTSPTTVRRLRGLLRTEELTRLVLKFHEDQNSDDYLFLGWLYALVPYNSGPRQDSRFARFKKVEDFSVEIQCKAYEEFPFDDLFRALPNVQNVSMTLSESEHAVLFMNQTGRSSGLLQRLRSLRMKLPWAHPDDFADKMRDFEVFLGDRCCGDLELFQLELRQSCEVEPLKARLYDIIGEKLRWIRS
ncbi:hypothetical protein SCHPADRAFT_1001233 [Schizopora paradoxa]|uniref:F-box domain-containing protein n=1 Tax=Schizopora paradoxa TaxID=27342 RepID=A0A0H2RT54_9AGAM|nr:hypothetical protein SCHPADRAFT_1001233 [Schizopora paradoxa]